MYGSDISSNSTDSFQTLLGIIHHENVYGLDDFDEALFTQSAESLGFPLLERSGSTIKTDSNLDSEDRCRLVISHQCSSEPSCSWTSLPEGYLQHFSPEENFHLLHIMILIAFSRMYKTIVALVKIGSRQMHSAISHLKILPDVPTENVPRKVSRASKNLIAERKRRMKRDEFMLMSLRALVQAFKMDKASIIADAITYIQSLQKKIKGTEVHVSKLPHSNIEEVILLANLFRAAG